MQRDHLYEYYKQATGILDSEKIMMTWSIDLEYAAILHGHVSKPYTNLDHTLLPRMIRAALQSPGLTIPQKKGILKARYVSSLSLFLRSLTLFDKAHWNVQLI